MRLDAARGLVSRIAKDWVPVVEAGSIARR